MSAEDRSPTDLHVAIEQRQQRLLAELDELNERVVSVLQSLGPGAEAADA